MCRCERLKVMSMPKTMSRTLQAPKALCVFVSDRRVAVVWETRPESKTQPETHTRHALETHRGPFICFRNFRAQHYADSS